MLKKLDNKINSVIISALAAISSTAFFAYAEGETERLGTTLRNLILSFVPMIRTIAIALAVVAVSIEGAKYIFASDSRSANEAKQAVVRIIIGLVLVLAATLLVNSLVAQIDAGLAG